MRDYIVTHAYDDLRFIPRVVRARDADAAFRAVLVNLRWTNRNVVGFRAFRGFHDDTLDVQPYHKADWQHTELIRLDSRGKYVRHLRKGHRHGIVA